MHTVISLTNAKKLTNKKLQCVASSKKQFIYLNICNNIVATIRHRVVNR